MGEKYDPDAGLKVVQAYNKAWMNRDLQGMKDVTSDDYIQWHSHIRKDFTKDEEFAMLEEALKVMHIDFHHVNLFAVDGGAVQQCLGDIKLSNGAEAKDVPFAMVYRVRGDKIVRCDEYVDGLSLPKMDFIPAT
jgi:ketosteroid isomerase-like protein